MLLLFNFVLFTLLLCPEILLSLIVLCRIFLQLLCTFDLTLCKMTHAGWLGSMPLPFNWMKNIQNEQWLNAVKDICVLNTGYKMFHLWVSRGLLIHLTRSMNDRCWWCNQATTFQFIANLLCVCTSGWNLCAVQGKNINSVINHLMNFSSLFWTTASNMPHFVLMLLFICAGRSNIKVVTVLIPPNVNMLLFVQQPDGNTSTVNDTGNGCLKINI